MGKMNGKQRMIIGLLSIFVLAVLVLFCCDIKITRVDETKETIEEGTEDTKVSELELFDSGIGLSIKMSDFMEENKSGDNYVYYFSDDVMVSIKKISFEELEKNGSGDSNTSLEAYASMVEEGKPDVHFEFENERAATTYTAEDKKGEYSFFVTLRKGKDAFWMINYSCVLEDADEMKPQFEKWDQTVKLQ